MRSAAYEEFFTQAKKEFSKQVKKYRFKKGFTQKQLADICDISYTTLKDIENGKRYPSESTIDRIADALDVDPWILMDGSSDDRLQIEHPKEDMAQFIEFVAEQTQRISEILHDDSLSLKEKYILLKVEWN